MIGSRDDDRHERGRRLRRERLAAARAIATHSPEQWQQILAEVDGECVCCGTRDRRLEKDHIIPIYQGGSDGIDNLQPLCASCNSSKGPDNTNWLTTWRTRRSV